MQQLSRGGSVNVLNAIVLTMVAFFNLLTQALEGQQFMKELPYSIFLVFIAVVILLSKSMKVSAVVFLVIAAITTMTAESISDFSGAIFFIFSFHAMKKKKFSIVVLVTTVLALSMRMVNSNANIPRTMAMFLVYAFCYLLYYFLMYKDLFHNDAKFDDLSEEENQYLQLLIFGLPVWIGENKVNHTDGPIHLSHIQEKLGYDSLNRILYEAGRNSSLLEKENKLA